MIDEPTEEEEMHQQIGRMWTEDSSLEKWFPFTARELTELRARVKELEALDKAWNDINSMNIDNIEKKAARIRELEEAMPHPFTLRRIATTMQQEVLDIEDAGRIKAMADHIEKVMRKEN